MNVDEFLDSVDIRKVARDWNSKVRVGYENISYDQYDDNLLGFHTLENGTSFIGMFINGDWETALFAIVYLTENDYHGYIPTDGNVFDKDNMWAWGNGPNESWKTHADDPYDWIAVKADILAYLNAKVSG